MFIYFHQHKFSYNKGQIAPLMILVLVILIIMAIVTVNIYKVAMDKTSSANAVDAGAIAGGSLMASIYNAQASANADLAAKYKEFTAELALLSLSAVVAAYLATGACAGWTCGPQLPCCPSPGCKLGWRVSTGAMTAAATAAGLFFHAQYMAYRNMRKQASEGRKQAIELAYRYAFYNSGIGSKLIGGLPPESTENKSGDDFNYSATYSEFLDSSDVTTGSYAWVDGQGRRHQAQINVTTPEIDIYKIQYGALPTPYIVYLLWSTRMWAEATATAGCAACPCTVGLMYETAAQVTIAAAIAEAGFIPAYIMDVSEAANVLLPICWVVDVNPANAVKDHRRLRVDYTLTQEGADLGLSQTQYPLVRSYSIVDFRGNGKILPHESEDLSYGADIVQTDVIKR